MSLMMKTESDFNPITTYGSGIKTNLKDFSWDYFTQQTAKARFEVNISAPSPVLRYTFSSVPLSYKHYFSSLIKEKQLIDKMHYQLLEAESERVIFIVIPRGIQLDAPITITTSLKKGAVSLHYVIIAEEGSTATIIEEIFAEEESYALMFYREVFTLPNACLKIYKRHQIPHDTFYLSKNKTEHAIRSKSQFFDDLSGGKSVHYHQDFNIIGDDARAEHYFAFTAGGESDYDLRSQAIQQGVRSNSKLMSRGLIQDEAKAFFQGNVEIHPCAISAQGAQRTDILLIGNKARAEAVPILNVKQNDITCSHAATITRLREEDLFYLKSRGLDALQAEMMLIAGFLSPITDLFPVASSLGGEEQ